MSPGRKSRNPRRLRSDLVGVRVVRNGQVVVPSQVAHQTDTIPGRKYSHGSGYIKPGKMAELRTCSCKIRFWATIFSPRNPHNTERHTLKKPTSFKERATYTKSGHLAFHRGVNEDSLIALRRRVFRHVQQIL